MIFLLYVLLLAVTPFLIIVSAFSIVPERTIIIQQRRREIIKHRVTSPVIRITTGDRSPIGGRRTGSLRAGLFGNHDSVKTQNNTHISPTSDWQIYVDQSKASLDRGGGATFDAFFSLCDHYGEGVQTNNTEVIEVQVIPAVLPKPVGGGKAPWIRCIWNTNKKNIFRPSPNLDVSNVDSVDKVYRILTKHLGVKNTSQEACECLKWKYKGSTFLESGEVKSAIDAYNEALSICEEYNINNNPNNNSNNNSAIILQHQEGIILLLRASAYLQQAQSHKKMLQAGFADDEETKLPKSQVLQAIFSDTLAPPAFPLLSESLSESSLPPKAENDSTSGINIVETNDHDYKKEGTHTVLSEGEGKAVEKKAENDDESSWSPSLLSSLVNTDTAKDRSINIDPQTASRLSMLRKLQSNDMFQEAQLRKLQYRHGLYQISLLQAARDSLKATEVLPNYSTAWLRAGELLSDLWKTRESKQYYEKALSIDESLEESLDPILKELEARQELLKRARASDDLSEDSLQLALDIVG
uniref:Uncharacterized protein n=1 Tax=Pseudo-nitzschia australis TaxID=44445 RepID=A0A7S4EFE5_9STRA|mmetsp:Transcript_17/g.38  ORF Transcript_17/g.38 Transcript_17/m.38 type:complete len:526 (-) Transcript_17:335-1912(-)